MRTVEIGLWGAAVGIILASVLLLGGCGVGGSASLTRIVCHAAHEKVIDITVPSAKVDYCQWDWGHNALCISGDKPGARLVLSPAYICLVEEGIAPAPSPVATTQPTPTYSPSPSEAPRK